MRGDVDGFDVCLWWRVSKTGWRAAWTGESGYFEALPEFAQGDVEDGVRGGDVRGVEDEDVPCADFAGDVVDGMVVCDGGGEDAGRGFGEGLFEGGGGLLEGFLGATEEGNVFCTGFGEGEGGGFADATSLCGTSVTRYGCTRTFRDIPPR